MYESLRQNNVAPHVHIDFQVSYTHYSYHRGQYSTKPDTKTKKEFGSIVLCTIDKALELLKEGYLMRARGPRGEYLNRMTLVIDESSLTIAMTMYEFLPYLIYFRQIILAGDPAQRSPFCAADYKLRSILEIMEAQVRDEGGTFIQHVFLNWQSLGKRGGETSRLDGCVDISVAETNL